MVIPVNFRSIAVAIFLYLSVAGLLSACGEESRPYSFRRVSTAVNLSDKLAEPFGIAVRGDEVYIADGNSGRILKASGGALTQFATGLKTPSAIAFDKDGNVFVADTGSQTIKKISPAGEITLIAGTPDVAGSLDGEALSARFNGPIGVAVADDGRVFVSDTYNDRIRVIEDGTVRTISGSDRGFADGMGLSAKFDTPLGIAIWKGDKLLVADSGNKRIRVVEHDGRVWTLAGGGDEELADGIPGVASFVSPSAIATDESGTIFIADGNAIRAIGLRLFPYVETVAGGRRGFANGGPKASRFNRPSGIALDRFNRLLITDSDNGLIRSIHGVKDGSFQMQIGDEAPTRLTSAEFREIAPGRWPYAPAERTREIAGTLGEIRGEIVDASSEVWFHNGLDIVGGYGETARFIRDETVLDPNAVENFETLRELIRMPTVGYIHIRLGRDSSGTRFGDPRFQFTMTDGKITDVRVPRGTRFAAGEAIGTLNPMNHVHLIAGRPGAEMNALDALVLPGVSDKIPPVIEEVHLFDENWTPIETETGDGRIMLGGPTRIVVRAYDRTDGNAERRRLAPYKVAYAISAAGSEPAQPGSWNISFERMPATDAVKHAYAVGSRSGATGETKFNLIATNIVDGDRFETGFIDTAAVAAGRYTLRIFVVDFFGNLTSKDIPVEVVK